ncbi:hypothetical protein [Actinoplanes sp. M2I2]|uniref:hypothetical protein n=1 Tax=Actinoplanes sp. M2I2 TaxID=1734444 RepID=UPI0020224F7B|nr:hypothetical protein [Actinoplanes sp. M2I2]
MPPEAFFSTTAQVLPALLIAFAVEVGALLRDPLDGRRQRVGRTFSWQFKAIEKDSPDWKAYEQWVQSFVDGDVQMFRRNLVVTAYVVLVLIATGEIAATWVLFADTPDGGMAGLAAGACLVTMTFSTIIVAAVPVVRLQLETGIRAAGTLSERSPLDARLARHSSRTQAHWSRAKGHVIDPDTLSS